MRVIICDDHKVFAHALAGVLASLGHEIVLVATRPDEAVAAALQERVDLVVMDLGFPTGDGLGATAELSRYPSHPPVFVLTARTDPEVLSAAIRAGAAGVLTKQSELGQVIGALERVATGETYFDVQLLRRAFVPEPRQVSEAHRIAQYLTDREREVLERIVRGESTRSMSAAMDISVTTLRSHIHAVLSKLSVHSRLEAAAWAVSHGIVDPPSAPDRHA
ncbi:two-component system nitrate/nitrite response regulator NarL [Kribbella orskensis]|uniref:Two-component system nitrate/nitrite response regulator NarL n=1 Tax=Kribbella orskensis TaxID=2512216 RepID=A0ABY2BFJ7_9ACTN|nr:MULTISPECIES: response regulator transcription factor [Kribbella]TCN37660.1 two-component system nitrate/nitrite response regulator NarL [Kribbella sp. VKM Ac-2500]TCO18838.1 two-component system nitrate/nitrite response regulator NarL [Kribbella orskensis]